MRIFLNQSAYRLVGDRLILEKAIKPSPGQIDLFSGEVYEPPAKKVRAKKDNGQLSLFSSQETNPELIALTPAASPSPAKVKPKSGGGRRRSPKGGGYFTNPQTGESKFFAGGKFIPAEFSQASNAAISQLQPDHLVSETRREESKEKSKEKSKEESKEDDRSLEDLFLEADRIGGKYQTQEEKDDFNRQLSGEVEAIGRQVDDQFPEEAPEVIDYSGTKPDAPVVEPRGAVKPVVAPRIKDPTSREAIAERMARLQKKKAPSNPISDELKSDRDKEYKEAVLQAKTPMEEYWAGSATASVQRDVKAKRVKVVDADHPTDAPKNIDYQETRGQKTRAKVNREVRELLARKQKDFTDDERQLLAKYSGWGGITGGDDASINEYYTRSDVAKFCVDLLHRHGFDGGSLLEPSCGAGVFLNHAKGKGVLPIGVEMDETSSAVARALNPHADVTHAQLERFCLDNPDMRFDAVVGNVPFGTRTVSKDFKASKYKLDQWKDAADFFVDESLEKLKAEGVMALIVPHGVVSGNAHMNLRQELVKKGRVLGVYRLPESAFKHSGTNVVADILVVQKHPESVASAIAQGDTTIAADPMFVGGGYFTDYPQNILGTATTKKRGFNREAVSVTGDINEEILNAAPTLTPTVEYKVRPKQKDALTVGSTKTINGRTYRLNENHRWELVDSEMGTDEPIEEDPAAFGTSSIAEAEAIAHDSSLRALIPPDRIQAYLSLDLDHEAREGLTAAKIAINQAGSSADRDKISHAVILAHRLKRLQAGAGDSVDIQKGLQQLQLYRERHGNPATDKALSAIALNHPALLVLQGAFDESGKISDFFADPEKLKAGGRKNNAAEALGEAFRATGNEPVTLSEVRRYTSGADTEAELLEDPTVGYLNGMFQPLDSLLVGNGYDLLATFANEAESLPPGDRHRQKLERQMGEVRSRLEPRSLEEMTTPVWAVGSWIPVDAFNQFMRDRGYNPVVRTEKGWVNDESGNKYDYRGRITSGSYTTEFEQDVVATMNRQRLSHGANTKEAKEAVAALELEFRDWLAASDYRLEVEQNYNSAFNGELFREHSGEPLEIAGIEQTENKKLHHYQNSTIRQMAEQGRGIISLGVGLGKTASAIALSQYLKQNGQAKKPSFVVPKSVLANWVREVQFWGPNLNVMIVGQTQQFWADGSAAWEMPGHKFIMKAGNPKRDKDGNYLLHRSDDMGKTPIAMSEAQISKNGNLAFKDDDAATKQRKLQQVAQNSYDMVLMSEPVFQSIALNPDREMAMLDKLTQYQINKDSKAAKEKSYKLQEQIETKRRQLLDRRSDKTEHTYWEDLGIDCLIHDEAHHLKNLFGTQRSGDVAFLSQAQSDRSLDFYYKSQYTRENNNNQNVFLLTATPTTNNPLEAYNMLQHVCPEEFEARGIENVDDFLQMFGDIKSVRVPGVDLEMTEKNGLVGFKNLKDLRRLFTKYCRMQSAKDVNLPIPEECTHDVAVDMTPAQQGIYASLKARAKDLLKKGQDSDREEGDDHIFSVISDMDKAAIDLEYYGETRSPNGEAPEFESDDDRRSPKIEACVERVLGSRAANDGKQIIFCDAVQMHEKIKQQLIAAGYPENEIQIVNAKTCSKSSDRQKVSQAYNDGRISIVIGNTATMGEGMNFQIGTTDIYHLTTPWTPAAIEQRNGRGVRQGNKLDEVNIHYFSARKSFDSYRKGVIERKRGWIDELWRGSEDTMDNANTGGMDMDEISIMLADDPEEARKNLESNREVQEQRFRDAQLHQSLKQFGQLQTMRLALSKMAPDRRQSGAGRELEEKAKQLTASLSRNEHFPYKKLLDGSQPAYVGTDGTVISVGDHLQMSDGSIAKVNAIDTAKQKFSVSPVFGTEYYPFSFDPAKVDEVDFKKLNSKRGMGVKHISFSESDRASRMLGAVASYDHLQHLTPEQMDANREGLTNQIKEGSYSSVPYVDADGSVKASSARSIPESGRLLFPHDEGAEEKLLRSMAAAEVAGENTYQYDKAIELLTGKSGYSDRERYRAKVAEYVQELKNSKPKEISMHDITSSVPGIEQLTIDDKARLNRLLEVSISQNDGKISQDDFRRVVGNATGDRMSSVDKDALASSLIHTFQEKGYKTKSAGTIKTHEDAFNHLRESFPSLVVQSHEMRNGTAVTVYKHGTNNVLGRVLLIKDSTEEVLASKVESLKEKVTEHLVSEQDTHEPDRPPSPSISKEDESAIQTLESAIWRYPKAKEKAIAIHNAVINGAHDAWLGNEVKERVVKGLIYNEIPDPRIVESVFSVLKSQPRYTGAIAKTKPESHLVPKQDSPPEPPKDQHPDPIGGIPSQSVLSPSGMSYKIIQHTKTGEELHSVSLSQRVDRAEYKRMEGESKQLGGYYSRYSKSFLFPSQDTAMSFMRQQETGQSLQKAAYQYFLAGIPYQVQYNQGNLSLVKSCG
jgi:SNF2 family DNA or RNA helicase